jgi:hypothetical protein
MGVRLYNPLAGRFLSTDPVPGGNSNAYEYCGANPLDCTDLSGMVSYPKYKKFLCHGLFASICRWSRSLDVKSLGFWVKSYVRSYGATCRKKWGMTACWHSPFWMYSRGGTTLGTTFVTGSYKYANQKDRITHEKEHRHQWYLFGLNFSVLYLREGTNPCKNYFEIKAGLWNGHYYNCFK